MKYSILGFNQAKVVSLKTPEKQKKPLTMNDLILLDYIQKALTSHKLKHIADNTGITYVWLQHKKIIEDLPILNIKEDRLIEMINKLIDFGLLTKKLISNEGGRGSKAYYTVTTLVEELIYGDSGPGVQNPTWSERPGVQNPTSNNTLNNNISNNKSTYNNKLLHVDNTSTPAKKKVSLYDKCLIIIDDFTDDDSLKNELIKYLKMLLESSREADKPFYSNSFKGKLFQLKKLPERDWLNIVKQSLDNGWQNFYALPIAQTVKLWDKDVKSEKYSSEELSDLKDREEEMKKRGLQTRF